MIQLNLLPDVKKEFLHAQRQRNLVMTISILMSAISVGVVIVLALVMGGQVIQKNLLTDNINRDKQTIQGEKDSKQLDEYLTVQNQLGQINSLKETQLIYSRLFDYLQQLNPAAPNSVELSSARITSAGSIDGGGNMIELQGVTANFQSLNVYKTTLERTMISYSNGADGDSLNERLFNSVTVGEAGISEDGGSSRLSFSITVEYNEAAFKSSSILVTLKIPQETTSDGDRNAPKNTFNATDDGANAAGENPEATETVDDASETGEGGE